MCTNLRIKTKDNRIILGRTMDLNFDLKSKILFVPHNTSLSSRAPEGKKGIAWQNTYSFLGLNAMGVETLSDGINDQGVYAGALYLPGFTMYQEVPVGGETQALSPNDVVMYILSNAASVAEAKELMKKVFVWNEITPQVNIAFPLHYSVQDKDGNAVVFEYVEGNLKTHDNPLGILTNAPTFDWHLINLRNYVNLTPNNALGKNLSGESVQQLGEGSGMLGLPGDFTPPSRFVRAAAYVTTALPAENEEIAAAEMFHMINNFDLVKGIERDKNGKAEGCDYTQWTTISDLFNLFYYVRMHDNPGFVRISLKDFDASKPGVITIDHNQNDWYKKISV